MPRMRPLDLAQSNSFPNGMGVEFDQAHEFLGLGSGRAVGQAGDHRQDPGEGFDRPARVGVGEGGAGDRLAAEMIMGVGVGVPARFERAQRRRPRQLGVDQHHQVLPAAERLVVSVGVPALDDRLEPPAIDGLDELAENGRRKAHAPLSFLSLYNQKIPRNLIKFPGFAGHALRHVESPRTLSPDSRGPSGDGILATLSPRVPPVGAWMQFVRVGSTGAGSGVGRAQRRDRGPRRGFPVELWEMTSRRSRTQKPGP